MRSFKRLMEEVREGSRIADKMGLHDGRNWKPLYVYIHVTRLIMGVGLGFILGILWAGIWEVIKG